MDCLSPLIRGVLRVRRAVGRPHGTAPVAVESDGHEKGHPLAGEAGPARVGHQSSKRVRYGTPRLEGRRERSRRPSRFLGWISSSHSGPAQSQQGVIEPPPSAAPPRSVRDFSPAATTPFS